MRDTSAPLDDKSPDDKSATCVKGGRREGTLLMLCLWLLRATHSPPPLLSEKAVDEMLSSLDGSMPVEEICCKMYISDKELTAILNRDPYTISFRT